MGKSWSEEIEELFHELEKIETSRYEKLNSFFEKAVKPAFSELQAILQQKGRNLKMPSGGLRVENGLICNISVFNGNSVEFEYPIRVEIDSSAIYWTSTLVEAKTDVTKVSKENILEDFAYQYKSHKLSKDSLSNFIFAI